MFAKWLSDMYHSTYGTCSTLPLAVRFKTLSNSPGVLRCLMGYIVDITIMLEALFWLKVAQPWLPTLCEGDIIAAFGLYQGFAEHLEVHRQIRGYVDNMTLINQVNPEDKTHLEVERLINSYRRVLLDTILSDATHARRETETSAVQPSPDSSEFQAHLQNNHKK